MNLNYEMVFDPPKKDLEAIDRGLHEFNLCCLGEAVIYDYVQVAIFARDQEDTVIGGIYGDLMWDWLYIQTLWVTPAYRDRGIGTKLLAMAEEAARSRGIYGSHLETTDFQALDFYLKNGYQVFVKLEGKPVGSTWYYIKKKLCDLP